MSAQPPRHDRASAPGTPKAPAPRTAAAERLRADAQRNRERILTAAREAYIADGLDVPLATIARRAGVGVATLYRRFPTRADLIAEAFAEQLAHCVATLKEALADPDPWRGLTTAVDRLCATQATDRGFTRAFLTQFPEASAYERERAWAEDALARLVQRAKDAGQLRRDFHLSDITLLMLANSGLTGHPAPVSLAASRRLVGYLLQSFRAEGAGPLPPPAPLGLEQVHQPTARPSQTRPTGHPPR
ncbi:TetR/AcrR family transcriptional regulator [Streptomyces sp. NPDC057702]|uniref:TetR/AcrR family transcriptional regulator n=1 Tax=unclassified Streptomyces TaxID=2593676 RepID=UPI003682101B